MSNESNNLQIDLIFEDKNQPRKSYNESQLWELADSIKSNGLIQPIIVRPNNGLYFIVCGHRRYRAFKLLKEKEIPAIIRDITADEATALQIIENLQREDVHPMEESRGFHLLVSKNKLSEQEISAKVGKSVYLVRQRLHLVNLIQSIQEVYLQNRITHEAAIKISRLSVEDQKHLYNRYIKGNTSPVIDIGRYQFVTYEKFLDSALFDKTDPDLIKRPGLVLYVLLIQRLQVYFLMKKKNRFATK